MVQISDTQNTKSEGVGSNPADQTSLCMWGDLASHDPQDIFLDYFIFLVLVPRNYKAGVGRKVTSRRFIFR